MKLSKRIIVEFQKNLLEFYIQNSTGKPWKKERNPYKIWLFEVIMQQTRMAQGIPYYERIIAKYPTLFDLAATSEDELFSLWKGLGYYSRARNLHYTAKFIVEKLNGKFPAKSSELIKLKGVGEYTAAAIASFAFGEDIAVLDGNVHRILSRIFGIDKTIASSTDKKYYQTLAQNLLPQGKSDEFNQAMMDLGSQICLPIGAKCDSCSMSSICYGYQKDKVKEFPPKKTKIELKIRHFYCLFVEYKGKIYLTKRTKNDIWKGLYEGIVQESKILDTKFWKNYSLDTSKIQWSDWQTQTLSHQKVYMKIGYIQVKKTTLPPSDFMPLAETPHIAFPRVISRWWEVTGIVK